MKTSKILLTIAGCFLLLGSLTAQVQKETRKETSFTKIAASNAIDVYYTQGNKYEIVLEADKKVLEKMITEVKDGTLHIKMDKSFEYKIGINKPRKAYISAPAIQGINISGASDFYADKIAVSTDFKLNASGASDAKIDNLKANSIDINLSGSSDLDIKELIAKDKFDINASGGSDAQLKSVETNGSVKLVFTGGSDCDINKIKTGDCNLSLSGGSDASIEFEDSGDLEAKASGGSDLELKGKVKHLSISTYGGSEANIKKIFYDTIERKSGGASKIKD